MKTEEVEAAEEVEAEEADMVLVDLKVDVEVMAIMTISE
ncbi:hypothetical protein Tco_1397009, partial [Tanacetum coccineum]